MWVYEEMLSSSLADDAYFLNELRKYFPNALDKPYFDEMVKHRLHREIISTYLTNGLVNRLGIETVFDIYKQTGRSIADITRAYAVVRDAFGVQKLWNEIGLLDNQVSAQLQLDIEIAMRRDLQRAILALLMVNDQIDVAKLTSTISALADSSDLIDTAYAKMLESQGLSAKSATLFARLPVQVSAMTQ